MQTILLVALQTSYETLALLFVYGQLIAHELIALQIELLETSTLRLGAQAKL
ncbi:unannotated protein [freshwater metagenome]|uniref:Unannotated protein n=1 Tax=freshwater metagenome TaxID=449393 RepID=A0A6J6B282_9ZZZZ